MTKTSSNKNGKISTKEKIFDVSVDLFSKKGFDAVSIREIAREVGIRESSIYNHYPSKETILNVIFQYFKKELTKMRPPEAVNIEKLTPDIFRERVHLTHMLFRTPTMEKIFKIIINEQFKNEKARKIVLHNLIEEPHKFTEKVLDNMNQRGIIRPLDPKIMAVEFQYPIFSLFMEYLLLKSNNLNTEDVETRLKSHVDFFLSVITPEVEK
ncbi:TetR/AcrR family transcriptional regulator [Methanobacterium paludis]|uniref:Transcriptional regulator, TetR family n=1 Tax=Methanobacterium paludis (strain DSM 25820 / JCM 18151 / SWAN1) TaxID=868131 RepID=F6D3Z4_METPW|nr:TetR/AcrR family transcriptional regulator [Methanobacterium paludis]AEG19171.1 transcriptional regulator, TetR family [Methanobacterium paludis]